MSHVTQVSIEEHMVADHTAGPYSLTTGPDGALWFTLVHSGRIGRLVPGEEPTSHRLDLHCGPTVITQGPDGALWFTEYRADRIGRITTDGVVDEFGVPGSGRGPFGIAVGPDGALWFTETAADRAEAVELAKSLPTPETIEIRPILESA